MIRTTVLAAFLLVAQTGCEPSDRAPAPGAIESGGSSAQDSRQIDRDRLVEHVRVLASDEYQGRKVGTAGGRLAADYVLDQMRGTDVVACADSTNTPLEAPFEGPAGPTGPEGSPVAARNIVGMVPGTDHPDRFIVITAHFDHLGIRQGEIYNGADDNASGTAVLIELARAFAEHPARHTLVFAALDAEESGLRGARAFLESACARAGTIVQNVNLDMVSRSMAGELYASGTYHYPRLKPALDSLDASTTLDLLFGHDEPGTGSDDWTMASDHGPFHAAGIPFVYFGVEDHPGYHHPTDDFDDITPDFFHEAAKVIMQAVLALDRYHDQARSE